MRMVIRACGVEVAGITSDETVHSGIAVITIDDTAQNRIIVLPGANATLGHKELDYLRQILSTAKVLLLQLEVPIPIVYAAAVEASEQRVMVVLDPAPVPPENLPSELYKLSSLITPNETEAASLVGFPLNSEAAIVEAGKIMRERGAGNVIIKLGSRGIFWTDGRNEEFRASFPATAVDTVGAGDAFNGALAVALSEGKSLDAAINWGRGWGNRRNQRRCPTRHARARGNYGLTQIIQHFSLNPFPYQHSVLDRTEFFWKTDLKQAVLGGIPT